MFEINASGKELDLLFKNCLGAYVSAQDLLLEGSILKFGEGDDQGGHGKALMIFVIVGGDY